MAERAVAFDVMGTLFDLTPLRERFGEAAFQQLLHATTAVTLAGGFVPFPELARATFAARGLDAGAALDVLARLEPYPDAEPAFGTLERAGVRIAVLTNGSEENTRTLLGRAGLADRVERVLTTEQARAYKPHPAPYLHAAAELGLEPDRVTLIAAHDWDVLGAREAGLGAVLVDRGPDGWRFPPPEPVRAPDLVAAAEAVA